MRPEPPRFEAIASFAALERAARRAARGHARSSEVARFLTDIEAEVLRLERELRAHVYRPQPWRTFRIREPKPRTISAAAFRDRVVHHALCAQLEPVLEYDAHPASFACRVGGGVKRALAHAHAQVRRYPWALKLDIRHFFETLDHRVLLRMLWRRVDDPDVRWLIRTFVEAGAPDSPPGTGLPIGNLTSQHFANFYLGALDRHLHRGVCVPAQVRYMDDVIVFGTCRADLERVDASVTTFAAERLRVAVKHEATQLKRTSDGVPFLGFVLWPSVVRFDAARRRRWHQRMNALQRGLDAGLVHADTAHDVAASLVGWSMHGDTLALRRAWVRRRV